MEFREQQGTISFEEAERRYAELEHRYEAGEIDEEQFDTERQRLLVRDDEGRWWAKSWETGRWHYHDGSAWSEANPPIFSRRIGSDNYSPERTEQDLLEQAKQAPIVVLRSGSRSRLLIGLGVLCAVLAVGLIAALAYSLTGEDTAGVTLSGSSSTAPPQQPAPPPGANVDKFVGSWANENPEIEISRLEITQRLDMINVQELASCEPRDCDRGTESTDVSDSDDGTLSITTNHGFAEKSKELTILSDGRLQVVEHTHFTDNSGRPDYDSTHYFRRATNDETKDESKPKDGAKSKTEPKPKTETKSKAATPSASASKASASEEVETAVRGHYKAIGAGDFEKAYSYFGPNLRGKIDEAEWVANERSNQIRGSTINSVRVEGVSGSTATATVDVSFRDKTGTPRFLLTWNLVQEGGGWKLDSQQSGQKVN